MYSVKCIIAFILSSVFLNVLKHRADLVTEYFHVKTSRDKAKSNYVMADGKLSLQSISRLLVFKSCFFYNCKSRF